MLRSGSLIASALLVASCGGTGGGKPASAHARFAQEAFSQRIAAGSESACVVEQSGAVRCWGSGSYGQLGPTGQLQTCQLIAQQAYPCSPSPITVSGITDAREVMLDYNGCALQASHHVECWSKQGTLTAPGVSIAKHLGIGGGCVLLPSESAACLSLRGFAPLSGLLVTQVAAAQSKRSDACAVTRAGSVRCWEVPNSLTSGVTVAVRGATQVAVAGDGDACSVLSNGTVDCWGQNFTGELGNGKSGPSPCDSDGAGNAVLACARMPAKVSGISDAVQVAVGGSVSHDACALLLTGAVKCWGENSAGQVGNGTDQGPNSCTVPGTVGPFLCSTSPTTVVGLRGAREVAVGFLSACALLSSGGVDCWGANDQGQLGIGSADGPQVCGNPQTGQSSCSTTAVAVRGLMSSSG